MFFFLGFALVMSLVWLMDEMPYWKIVVAVVILALANLTGHFEALHSNGLLK